MARERVDGFMEAKRLSEEHERVRPRRTGPDIHAGQQQLHGASGQNMDGIAANFDQLNFLNGQLQALRDELTGHLSTAGRLAEPLSDGTSPVTGPMRKAFLQRADAEEGVAGVLTQYLRELDAVKLAITSTLNTYRGVDGDAAARFDQVANQEDAD
ncbi:hypothetical protein [Actinophytocola sp.]|uniref:hypothetical protein n=1 Tax=Actinophytocola sp. TaxID=1872138 RepID=UPI003D6AEC9E